MLKENRDTYGDFKIMLSNGWKSYGNDYSYGFRCEYIFFKMCY